MTSLPLIVALAAAVLLLTSGYLIGVRRGSQARERLRDVAIQQKQALQLAHREISRKVEEHEQGLRATIEQALAPLVSREKLSLDLSSLKTGAGSRDLTLLLDKIAEVGNFSAVALSDSEGLPLAGNSAARDLDRIAVNSSLVLLMADRIGGELPAPTAILVRDGADQVTLYRIFQAPDQRIVLTAVSNGAPLTLTTLDPALAKVAGMLSFEP
jgi:predicted regulator of Ras-like GTPase activity (Roadblock/LC7/MglB family)